MDTFLSIALHAFLAAGTGFAVCYLLTPIFIKLAPSLGLMDLPRKRHIHTKPIPRGGGIVLLIATQAVFLMISLSHFPEISQSIDLTWWTYFSIASLIITGVGLVDDLYDIKPLIKLSGQVIGALIVYSAGVKISAIFSTPLPPGVDLIATLLWFVIITNSFNLIDGIDGLSVGLATIAALGAAGGLMPRFLYFEAFIMFGFAGACIAFFRFNRSPAKVFLGDAGSNFIGFLLAAIMIETGSKASGMAYICIPLFAVSIPILDTTLAIWRRSFNKLHAHLKEQTPKAGVMSGDLEHIHHRLQKQGISDRDVTGALCLINAVLVIIALLMVPYRDSAIVLLISGLIFAGFAAVRVIKIHEIKVTKDIFTHLFARPTKPILALMLFLLIDSSALSAALLAEIQIVHRNVSKSFVLSEFFRLAAPWVLFSLLFLILIETSKAAAKVAFTVKAAFTVVYTLSAVWLVSSILILLDLKSTHTVVVQLIVFFSLAFVFVSVVRILAAISEKVVITSGSSKKTKGLDFNFYARIFRSK